MALTPPSSRGSSGSGTVTSVTAGDTSIVVGGTPTDPTIETATLDVIAADHPPAANWSNNSKRITSLANGAAAQDAAAFGQIPTALPPNGAAGGDLAGSFPNPTFGLGKVLIPPTRPGIAESFPRTLIPGNAGASGFYASQTLLLTLIALPAGLTVTSIAFASGTTPLNTGTHQIFGLFDDNTGHETGTPRALLRGTSDDTSTAWAATTVKTLNLTSPYTTVNEGLFYVGILVAATTPPSLLATTGVTTAVTGLAPILCGSSSTGVTALPNPAAAMTAAQSTAWCYLS